MKVSLLPKTKLGKLSVGLVVAMPTFLFIGSSFTNTLYESVPAGETIPKDIIQRPVLALTMLLGMACGVLAFAVGLITIVKKKERAILTFIATFIGMIFSLFLLGEILFPH